MIVFQEFNFLIQSAQRVENVSAVSGDQIG
jgi:hypothetical protein